MFPMSITIHNPAQLHAVLAALNVPAAAPAEPTTEQLIQIAKDRAVDKDAPVWPHPTPVAHSPETAAAPVEKPSPAKTARSKPTAEAAAPAPAAAPAQSTEQAAPQTGTAPAAAASSAPEPVVYDTVAAAITAAVKVNREHVVDTLTQFGVRKGPELKPEQYAAFLAALNDAAVPA